jgi:hypothetical protein
MLPRNLLAHILYAAGLFACKQSFAVGTVNPNGVNVRSAGVTSVFLTFQNLDPGERSIEAVWCGEVLPGVVGGSTTATDPCIPGTIFGRLPLRVERSQTSRSGSLSNLSDVMSIPASVARRAYQAAESGQPSDFFYVRRFTGGLAGDRWVVVTCRMGGGGARSPLALLNVRYVIVDDDIETTTIRVERDAALPEFGVRIQYNGTGRLIGRWELVEPGDIDPADSDLLTEATLSPEQRGSQRRYAVLEHFDRFLLPDGETFLPGPDPRLLPTQTDGAFKILLRIDASREKEGLSNTGGGRIAASGGVAGFPMPVLRYFVGATDDRALTHSQNILLLAPAAGHERPTGGELRFSWIGQPNAAFYRIEFADADELIADAFVPGTETAYEALVEGLGPGNALLAWRVSALDSHGTRFARSDWRRLSPAHANP